MREQLERLAMAPPPRWNADPEDVRRSVVKLVATLIEFIRQLLERQAIRRMDAGTLTPEQTEAVGLALMRLEETIRDLGAQFGIAPEDLTLDLGPVGRLMKRARVILNPSSGRERGPEHAELLNTRLKERFDDVTIVMTAGDGDAERAAKISVADGCEALFVAGGDGTLNEAMNGLAEAGALSDIVVGIIPFGMGNDFAAALGIPWRPNLRSTSCSQAASSRSISVKSTAASS